jgi:hypothetical protein
LIEEMGGWRSSVHMGWDIPLSFSHSSGWSHGWEYMGVMGVVDQCLLPSLNNHTYLSQRVRGCMSDELLEEKCPHCHRLEWARFDRSFASPDPKVKGILHYWEQFQCRHCGYLHRVPTRAED